MEITLAFSFTDLYCFFKDGNKQGFRIEGRLTTEEFEGALFAF